MKNYNSEKSKNQWTKRKNTVNEKRRVKYNEKKDEINEKRRNNYNSEKRKSDYKKKKNEKKYNNIIYCIDIETCTIENGVNFKGETKKCSYMISACTSCIDINTGEVRHYKLDRTYKQLSETIEEIYQSTEKETLIYCHNFSYEFDFFKNNVSFFHEHTCNKQIFVKSHKPLMIKYQHIQFRCSYLLSNISVKTMGEKLTGLLKQDWKKLDYEYNKIRTPLTPLTQKEIDYNFRDTDIVVLYIYHFIVKKYGIDVLNKKLYTITSIARYVGEIVNDSKNKKMWYKFNRKCMAQNEFQLSFWYILFSGGLCTSNPNYFLKVIDNVASFDFSSSYPYCMFNHFPIKFRKKIINLEYFKDIEKDTKLNVSIFFNCIIDVSNIRINNFKYPIQSIYKCTDLKNEISINGKLVKANSCRLYLTSLDYFMLTKFYEFEIINIIYYEQSNYNSKLSDYTLNTVNRLLQDKSEFKEYNNIVTDSTMDKDFIFKNEEITNLLKMQPDLDTKKYVMKDEYLTIKGQLNSQYGVLVQKPLSENIVYNFETLEYEKNIDDFEKYINQRNPKTNLIVGLYVTAFARYNLLTVLYLCLKNNINVYYTDTDSIKVDYTDKGKVDEVIKIYNSTVNKNKYNIGYMDFEGVYDKFVTNGNKSYITLHDSYINATMSGLPKASTIYNELFKKCGCNFDELIKTCYRFNTKLDYTVTNKLTTKYGDKDINNIDFNEPIKSELIHVVVDNYNDYVYTGTILEDCDLTIRDIETSKSQLNSALVLNKIFDIPKETFFGKYLIKYDGDYIVQYNGQIHEKIKELFT